MVFAEIVRPVSAVGIVLGGRRNRAKKVTKQVRCEEVQQKFPSHHFEYDNRRAKEASQPVYQRHWRVDFQRLEAVKKGNCQRTVQLRKNN